MISIPVLFIQITVRYGREEKKSVGNLYFFFLHFHNEFQVVPRPPVRRRRCCCRTLQV